MKELIVGIGDIVVSNKNDTIIKTFALGSCVAVMIFDASTGTGGMIHIALPDSNININKSRETPGYFADTGIPELLRLINKNNPRLKPGELIIKIAGGASILDNDNFFNVGELNLNAVKKILKEARLSINKEDTGKKISRTVIFDLSKNKTTIINQNLGSWEL